MTPSTLPENRDLRLGGRWSPSQRAKNAALRWLIVCALSLADRLPERLLETSGRLLGRLAHRVLRRDVALAEARVAHYLPDSDAAATVREAFINAGRNLATCLMLRRATTRALDRVRVPRASLEALSRALEGGRGAVFVSAHLGPFELIAPAVRELGFLPVIVVRESYDPKLDAHVDAHRCSRGVEVVHRGKPGAAARILRALRGGRPVGILPDLGARVPSRSVPFLAGRALLPIGPARLAARLRVPLVVGTLEPAVPGRFELRIERIPDGPESELLAGIARTLGERVAARPAEWLWMGAKSLEFVTSTPPVPGTGFDGARAPTP